MDKQTIIDYVMNTPMNTNPAILGQFIDEVSSGGSSEISGYPVVWAEGTSIVHMEFLEENDIIPELDLPVGSDYSGWEYPYIFGKDDNDLAVSSFMSSFPNGIIITVMAVHST